MLMMIKLNSKNLPETNKFLVIIKFIIWGINFFLITAVTETNNCLHRENSAFSIRARCGFFLSGEDKRVVNVVSKTKLGG